MEEPKCLASSHSQRYKIVSNLFFTFLSLYQIFFYYFKKIHGLSSGVLISTFLQPKGHKYWVIYMPSSSGVRADLADYSNIFVGTKNQSSADGGNGFMWEN